MSSTSDPQPITQSTISLEDPSCGAEPNLTIKLSSQDRQDICRTESDDQTVQPGQTGHLQNQRIYLNKSQPTYKQQPNTVTDSTRIIIIFVC
jgi:hypothetical protein